MAPEATLEFFEEWIPTPGTTREMTMAMILEIKKRRSASTMTVQPTGHERIEWTLKHHLSVYYEEADKQDPAAPRDKKPRGTFCTCVTL